MHIGIAYSLVHWTSLGYIGAPLGASIILWISALLLSVVLSTKKFKQTWEGFSSESFRYLVKNFKLSVPSASMVCLEYWAFESLVLLAGLMPNVEISISPLAICVHTETVAYMTAYGLSAAARVSNKLGAGNPLQAKRTMIVAIKLSLLLAIVVVSAVGLGHKLWARLFTDDLHIIDKFTGLTPILVTSMTLNCVQGVLSGVARGCGWQHYVAYVNLANFYIIGLPLSIVLGFIVKLYNKGLWIGLICGLTHMPNEYSFTDYTPEKMGVKWIL